MFFWLTALLTLAILPVVFVIGKPVRVTTVRACTPGWFWGQFPLARLTPVVMLRPWPWFQRHMERRRIRGYAFLGFVVMSDLHSDNTTVIFHEAVHIAHQSTVSPVLFGLAYALDLLMWYPFRRWFHSRAVFRVPVAELVAHRVANDEPHLAP